MIGHSKRVWLRELSSRALGLLGRVIPSLERSLGEEPPSSRYGEFEVRVGLVRWFIALRWVAVFVSAAVIGFATQVSRRVAPESAPSLWAGVFALAVFNAVLSFLGPRRLVSQRALGVQVAGDVAALGWLVHNAGGLQNPFSGLFVFHAVIAALAMEERQARRVAVSIASFVLALTALEASAFPPGCLFGDAQGACAEMIDWMFHGAAGAGVAVLVVGCAFIVIALVRVLQAERELLAETLSAL